MVRPTHCPPLVLPRSWPAPKWLDRRATSSSCAAGKWALAARASTLDAFSHFCRYKVWVAIEHMPRLYLIRHARPAAAWGEEADPGLDATGQQQAEAAARTLAQTLDSMPIYTSPLRRCRETARPLEQLWQRSAGSLRAGRRTSFAAAPASGAATVATAGHAGNVA
jgi:Histidine phosphatase superfamily (branch 1)